MASMYFRQEISAVHAVHLSRWVVLLELSTPPGSLPRTILPSGQDGRSGRRPSQNPIYFTQGSSASSVHSPQSDFSYICTIHTKTDYIMGSPVSIGDVIEIIRITKKVIDRYQDAPADRRELVDLVESINRIIKPIDEEKFDDLLTKNGNDTLEYVLKGLKATLEEVDKFTEAYELSSGLGGFFKRANFAFRTQGRRDRFRRQLEMHRDSLTAALSSAGLQATKVLNDQMKFVAEKQDGTDENLDRIVELVLEVRDLVKNDHGRVSGKPKHNGPSRTKTLQTAKQVSELDDIITGYSDMTGIDKRKVERTVTLALTSGAGISSSYSQHVNLRPNLDNNAAGSSKANTQRSQTPVRASPATNSRTASPQPDPNTPGNDLQSGGVQKLRNELHEAKKQNQRNEQQLLHLKNQLEDTKRERASAQSIALMAERSVARASQSAREADGQRVAAEERASVAEEQCDIWKQRAYAAKNQVALQIQRTCEAENQLDIEVRRALKAENELAVQTRRANELEQQQALAIEPPFGRRGLDPQDPYNRPQSAGAVVHSSETAQMYDVRSRTHVLYQRQVWRR